MVRGIANSDEIRKMSNLPETEEELKLISKILTNKIPVIYIKNLLKKY